MAKRHLFLHIGPDVVELDAPGRERLAALGVLSPDLGSGQLERADLEIRRAHRSAGLRRKDVEGAWAKVCRRAFRLRSDAYLSVPGFAGATQEQAALAVDGLHGLRVHLLVSTGTGTELPADWTRLVKDDRIHAVGAGLSPEGLADALARIAVSAERARLDKRLAKLKRRRRERAEQLVA